MNIHDFDNNGAMFPLLNWMPRQALLSLFEPSDEHTHYVTGIQKFGPEAGERAEVSYDTIKAFKDGWKVSLTEISGDYGGDLIAERDELHWCI